MNKKIQVKVSKKSLQKISNNLTEIEKKNLFLYIVFMIFKIQKKKF